MKHHATKKTKPRSFDDIVADQDLLLPSLEYFFGRVSLRVSLFCCPDLNNYWIKAY